MNRYQEKLIEGLFETKAIRVCPQDSPFWYTSGKIGPYYINTHFLYGREEKANALLKAIDEAKEDKELCSDVVLSHVMQNYKEDRVFQATIDILAEAISQTVGTDSFDYISGGERRDWFFSLPVAALFKKPHITIFKDMDASIYHEGVSTKLSNVNGARVLHIADLITSASSYERAWVPAIQKAEGNMQHSFVMIDRMQGGAELLKQLGVVSHALVKIDAEVFKEAVAKGYINEQQYRMVLGYMDSPDAFMEDFFIKNPEFLEKALKGDEKTAQRARLCIESGYVKG